VFLSLVNSNLDDIESGIGTLSAQELGQTCGHNAYATTHVKHSVMGLETGKINKVSHVFFIDRLIVLFPSHEPQTVRRNQGIAAASDRLKNIAWQVCDATHQKARLKSREKPLSISATIHRLALWIKFGWCWKLKQHWRRTKRHCENKWISE